MVFVSCDYYDGRLNLTNNSNKAICFDYNIDTVLDVPSVNKKEYFLRERILTGETKRVVLPGSTEQWLREIRKKKDLTLSLFIFDYELTLKSNWDTLRKNNLYLKRLDLTLEELNRLNWTIEIK
jgi:hypothetical protein